MFTGIIEETGRVESRLSGGDIANGCDLIEIASNLDHSNTKLGDSIAVDGVCLTVVKISKQKQVSPAFTWLLSFEIGSETLRCTTLGGLKGGDAVHLERSLHYGGRLHGHFVSGHVDGVISLKSKQLEGKTIRLEFDFGDLDPRLVAAKGAVTISGVSLTVGEVKESSFSVYIIPHTSSVTYLSKLEVGQRLNIEFDMLARYLERLSQSR